MWWRLWRFLLILRKDIWSQLKNLKETKCIYKWPGHRCKVSNEFKFSGRQATGFSQPCSILYLFSWVVSRFVQSHCKSNHSIEVDLSAIPSDFLSRGQLIQTGAHTRRAERDQRKADFARWQVAVFIGRDLEGFIRVATKPEVSNPPTQS